MCFQNRATMIHHPRKISIRKRDSAKSRRSQNLSGRRLSIHAKKEPGLRVQVRMPPAVQNNAGNIAACLETRARKHVRELFANLTFVVAKRRIQNFFSSPAS